MVILSIDRSRAALLVGGAFGIRAPWLRASGDRHPGPWRRLEYTTLIQLHFDMSSMQCNQRGAMPDRDDGRVRQNLGENMVDFRFQLLVKRRCRLIEKQPIWLLKNSPRNSQTLL